MQLKMYWSVGNTQVVSCFGVQGTLKLLQVNSTQELGTLQLLLVLQ